MLRGFKYEENLEEIDRAMMTRCVELSRLGAAAGEMPFGSLIARNGVILAEATNETVRRADESRHAEIIAIAHGRRLLGSSTLRGCTLYSTVEPCPMCSICIRGAQISRVVFGLNSPVMGGLSRWNILCDEMLSDRIPLFGAPPEVVSGILADEVQEAWSEWKPLLWKVIKRLGFFTKPQGSIVRPRAAGFRRLHRRIIGMLSGL
jgi:tRNA(adenine34) deaminase